MSESSHKIYRAVVSSEVMDELMVEPRVILPTDVTHRFHKVLRLKNGAAVEVIDGSGRSVRGLLGIAEQQITLLEPEIFETGPKPPPLWLAQALIRPNKLEPLIQKATEMGVTRIVLWEAERGEARWYGDKDHKKKHRLEKIALEATRQSGRYVSPVIEGPLQASEFNSILLDGPAAWVVGDPAASNWLSQTLQGEAQDLKIPHGVIVGPEGGLTEGELKCFQERHVTPVRLSPHVLRTETAAFPFLCGVQWLRGRL